MRIAVKLIGGPSRIFAGMLGRLFGLWSSCSITSRLAEASVILSFFVCCILLAVFRPIHNWDSLPYVALILERTESLADAGELHRRTYQVVRAQIDSISYARLVGAEVQFGRADDLTYRSYRPTMAANPEAFVAQLPYYRQRWLYTFFGSALVHLGVPVVLSLHLLSAVGTFALLTFAYSSFRILKIPTVPSLLVVAGLVFLTNTPELAQGVTPDGGTAAALVAAGLGFVWRRWAVVFICLTMAILLRSDAMIFGVLISGALPRRGLQLVGVIGSAALFGLQSVLSPGYGWWTLFSSNCISYLLNPAINPAAPFSVVNYLAALVHHLPRAFLDSPCLVFALVGSCVTLLSPVPSRVRYLILVVIATLLVRLALFPFGWSRLLAPYIYLVAFSLTHTRRGLGLRTHCHWISLFWLNKKK